MLGIAHSQCDGVRVTRDFIVEAFTPMKGTEPIGEKQKGKQKGAQGRGAQTHTG